MKTFGIIGLTRKELDQHQFCLDVTRKHPDQVEHFWTWLRAIANGGIPPSERQPEVKEFWAIHGEVLVRRNNPK